jgi:hypothetical protein
MKTNRKPTSAISRQAPQRRSSWQYYAAAVVCCAVLVAGFFLAARQHFSSMEYGLQNSRLRRELDELQAEKRRLLISREVSLTPAEIRKAVRRVGFVDDTDAVKDVPAKGEQPAAPKMVVRTAEVTKKDASTGPTNKVVPTVISAPANKPSLAGKQARRDAPATKKDRT